jgi:hypothetical protein
MEHEVARCKKPRTDPPKATMTRPELWLLWAKSDNSGSDNKSQVPGRALACPERYPDPPSPPSVQAEAARRQLQTDDFVLVENAQGGCGVATVVQVYNESDRVRLHWYGPERGQATILLARWLPRWVSESGSSMVAASARCGLRPDEHETDWRRIVHSFDDLDDDQTLPPSVLRFLLNAAVA